MVNERYNCYQNSTIQCLARGIFPSTSRAVEASCSCGGKQTREDCTSACSNGVSVTNAALNIFNSLLDEPTPVPLPPTDECITEWKANLARLSQGEFQWGRQDCAVSFLNALTTVMTGNDVVKKEFSRASHTSIIN